MKLDIHDLSLIDHYLFSSYAHLYMYFRTIRTIMVKGQFGSFISFMN